MDADAIVIGAGAAGLAAARTLASRSLNVIVLEGRDRIGGRVWSRQVARNAVPAELGAEFIHGRAEETIALLRDAGSSSIDTTGEGWRYTASGRLEREEGDFLEAAQIFDSSRSLPEDESVDQFLHRFDGDPKMREVADAARLFVEGFEAADTTIASTRSIADEWRSGVDSTAARPLGGYPPVFERLGNSAVAAGVQMCLSTTVRRVAWQRGSVAVAVDGRYGGPGTIRGRTAIVTLPVGVLRQNDGDGAVVFEPELPAIKRKALGSIEMGHAVKVVLCFRTPFWEELRDGLFRDGAFFRSLNAPFPAYWTQYPVRSELVTAWAGGPKAIALSEKSESEMIGSALDGFGYLFGEQALAYREFEGGIMHDWTRDSFARGAYSYVAVGGGDARAVLGQPLDDTLFFAGEATSTDGHGGTVNGALETGERAAKEVLASLGIR